MKISGKWVYQTIQKIYPDYSLDYSSSLKDLQHSLTLVGLETTLIEIQKVQITIGEITKIEGEGLQVQINSKEAILVQNTQWAQCGWKVGIDNGNLYTSKGYADTPYIIRYADEEVIGKKKIIPEQHILDVKVLSNRLDAHHVYGLARAYCQIKGFPIYPIEAPAVSMPLKKPQNPIQIDLSQEEMPLYYILSVQNIKHNCALDPMIMERLYQSGMVSKHSLLNLLYYVQLFLGQPMHIMDYQQLEYPLSIRYSRSKESMQTLKRDNLSLDAETAVFADRQQVHHILGIIGGKSTMFTENTEHAWIECASFSPQIIKGRAKKYQQSTHANTLFEYGIDPTLSLLALQHLAYWINYYQTGECKWIEKHRESKPKQAKITVKESKIWHLLGYKPEKSLETLLKEMHYEARSRGDRCEIKIPPHRYDLHHESDIVEEVLSYTLQGFHQHSQQTHSASHFNQRRTVHSLKNYFVDLGFYEVYHYGLVHPAQQQDFNMNSCIHLKKPISENMSVLRNNLWTELWACAKRNYDYQNKVFCFFEIGKVFSFHGKKPLEEEKIGGIIHQPSFDFAKVKHIVEQAIQITHGPVSYKAEQHPGLYETASSGIYYQQKCIGWMGQYKESLSADTPVYLFEYELSFSEKKQAIFNDFSLYPMIKRDISFWINGPLTYQNLVDCIWDCQLPLIHVSLFDIYKQNNQTSWSISLTFQKMNATCTAEEADHWRDEICSILSSRFNIQFRVL